MTKLVARSLPKDAFSDRSARSLAEARSLTLRERERGEDQARGRGPLAEPRAGRTARYRASVSDVGDAIVIADVFKKKTARPPQNVIAACRRRLLGYDLLASDEGE